MAKLFTLILFIYLGIAVRLLSSPKMKVNEMELLN